MSSCTCNPEPLLQHCCADSPTKSDPGKCPDAVSTETVILNSPAPLEAWAKIRDNGLNLTLQIGEGRNSFHPVPLEPYEATRLAKVLIHYADRHGW